MSELHHKFGQQCMSLVISFIARIRLIRLAVILAFILWKHTVVSKHREGKGELLSVCKQKQKQSNNKSRLENKTNNEDKSK